jgi:branched-chain amino acid aminotransferase
VFLTGTAAEVTPVRSVDKIPVGEGKRGPITERLQKLFFGLFDGSTADRFGWLEPIVEPPAARIERPKAV